MRRVVLLVAVAVAGIAAGAGVGLAVQGSGNAAAVVPAPASSAPPSSAPARGGPSVLLAWTSGGLPAGFANRVRALPGVLGVTVVAGDALSLRRSLDADGTVVDAPPAPFVIPLDGLALDPATYAGFVPKDAAATLARLGPTDAALGETSARLRRIGVGGVLELAGGTRLRVAAVLPDEVVGAAEVVVRAGAAAAVTTPRYLLVSFEGDANEIETSVRAALPESRPLRLRLPGETPYLRYGDAVLPQALVKARFGEFAFAAGRGRAVEIDPAWVRTHIATERVPLLGRVTCHRAVIGPLRAALARLAADGVGWLVPPSDFAGCFSARVATNGETLSRHAWGIAVDLNATKLPLGTSGQQDPRLVGAMRAAGFTNGAEWLVPDPQHFEWVGTP